MHEVVQQTKLGVLVLLTCWSAACAPDEPGVVAGYAPAAVDAGAQAGGAPEAGAGTTGGGVHAGQGADAGTPPVEAGVIVGPDAGLANCAASAVKAEIDTAVEPADIIFAIDSSGSMDEEIAFVQAQMNEFSRQIRATGIDVRVILIGEQDAICIGAPLGSGRCPDDTKLPRYLHIDRRVGSNDGLNVIVDSYPEWSSQLRLTASKSFVIITDDEASAGPNDSAAAFIGNLEALDEAMFAEWTFNGIFVQQDCAQGRRIGNVYADLVTQTQGVSGDLCLQDFLPVFDRLSQKIVTSASAVLACNWDIPAPPAGEKLDFGSVNLRYVDSTGTKSSLGKVPSGADCPRFINGWYYDDEQAPKVIIACPQSCRQLRTSGVSEVEVLLGCKSEPPIPLL